MMRLSLVVLPLLAALVTALVARRVIVAKEMHWWLRAYLARLWRRAPRGQGPIHVMFCITDHFEPMWNNAPLELQRKRMRTWLTRFPELARRHRDADGQPLRHTFFYPAEEYLAEHLDGLASICRQGFGDVEVHLHHDNDTAENLRATLSGFAKVLHERHGLLRRNRVTGRIEYGFIHGNWALDNSRPDGRWCGVNNELTVLRETGCYADFTFPSAPDCSQPGKINAVYYATDDPDRPKSHDRGPDLEAGGDSTGDLVMVQGPLTLNWRSRVRGLLPRIENGELTGDNPPTPQRADLWIKQHIHVKGQPSWIFVKLHTHGADERDTEALLGGALDRTLRYLEERYNDGVQYCLHYVTARELYNIARAAEAGCEGDPNPWRRFMDAPKRALHSVKSVVAGSRSR